MQVYFHEHVVPLLDQLGNKLTQLSLEKYFTFLACVKTNLPADQFYSTKCFQVQVCRCGGDRRELPETTKSAPLQNPLLLQHPLTEVVTKIHQHS